MFLNKHERSYNLSLKDAALSLATGLSGFPYAKRHWDLSKSSNKLGHRTLAIAQFVPGLGVMVALVERISFILKQKITKEPKTHSLPKKTSKLKPEQPQKQPDKSNQPKPNTGASGQLKDESIPAPKVQGESSPLEPLKRKKNPPPPPPKEGRPALSDDLDNSAEEEFVDVTLDESTLESEQTPVDQISEDQSATSPPWETTAHTIDHEVVKKMWKKSVKAIKKHAASKKDDPRPPPKGYAPLDKALPSLEAILENNPQPPLTMVHFDAALQGRRKTMEDAHFYKDNLIGVFDGHGNDAVVANLANEQFPLRFPEILAKSKGDVASAFTLTIKEIHEEVKMNEAWNFVGATAVVCYIDKQTRKIYTATLGDSEANLYRKIDGKLQSIPLSVLKDWSNKKEVERAGPENISSEGAKPRLHHPKFKAISLNVSRALGDVGHEAVSHEPFITINEIQPGDILVLACDGLKDFANEEEIISILEGNHSNPAEELAQFVLEKKWSTDNITVQVVQFASA